MKKIVWFLSISLILLQFLAFIIGYVFYDQIKLYSVQIIYLSLINIDNAPAILQIFLYIIFGIFACVYYRICLCFFKQKSNDVIINNLHGSARFLTFNEIQTNTNLIDDEGIFIGGYETTKGLHYLRSNGNEHCLILAPTRAGKGVCLVIPTLLTWKHSAIIYDIKRELFHLTSKWRAAEHGGNNNVFKFDPAELDTHCFNPMNEIRINTPYEMSDAQNMAYMLADENGKGLNDHWVKTAFNLFSSCILYVAHKNYDENKTHGKITDILNLLCDQESIIKAMKKLSEFKCAQQDAQKIINQTGREMLGKDIRELSGVISTTVTQLSLYRDPLVAHSISKSDFTIDDITNATKPTTLYLVTDPNNKDRYQPLIRLILNMMLRRLNAKINFENGKGQSPKKYRLLLLLDEFTSLGHLPIIEESLAFMAGYGIKAMLIAQDLNQIYAKYQKTESIISNCHIITAFTPNNVDTASWLCKKLGDTTIIKNNISTSGKRKDLILSNTSNSQSEIKRPLMTPDEIMTMSGLQFNQNGKLIETGNMLVLINGQKPILGKQIPFFLDDEMNAKI